MPSESDVKSLSASKVAERIKTLNSLDMVLIGWVDAHALFLEGWVSHEYVTSLDMDCTVQSLGYFICVKDDFLVLAMDVIHPNEDNFDDEYNSASAIPIACIKSIEVITVG